MKKKIYSKDQLDLLNNWKVGEEKFTSEVKKTLEKKHEAVGGILSGLYRGKEIEPLYYEYKDGNKDTLWKRIK